MRVGQAADAWSVSRWGRNSCKRRTHARNVLVGVRRGEVQYPAVFDYGDMSDHNVLAWDFAKLETELKARLLPVIMGDGAVSAFLIERGNLRKPAQADRQAPDDRHKKKHRYWLYATEGEAALILNEPAESFYRSALRELTPGQWGMADSSYKQVCRLWRGGLGDRVEPVLKLFESGDLRSYLTPHFLGRDFAGEKP